MNFDQEIKELLPKINYITGIDNYVVISSNGNYNLFRRDENGCIYHPPLGHTYLPKKLFLQKLKGFIAGLTFQK